MTIYQAITQVDELRCNGYPPSRKVAWLSQLDGKIVRCVLDHHEGVSGAFSGYDKDTPMDRELLVEEPFSELYIYYLEAQICYADGEIGDYNNAIARFQQLFSDYIAYYNQNHPWRQRGRRFLF